jgi:hypothetical protein
MRIQYLVVGVPAGAGIAGLAAVGEPIVTNPSSRTN